MKKLFSIYLAMLMAFSGAVTVFASPPVDPVAPYFISIYNVSYTFNIDGSTAKAKIRIMPKSNNEPDYIKVTVKLMKSGSSTPIKTWSDTLYIDKTSFKFYETKKLSSKGSYYMDAKVKAYKDGKLIETESFTSDTESY